MADHLKDELPGKGRKEHLGLPRYGITGSSLPGPTARVLLRVRCVLLFKFQILTEAKVTKAEQQSTTATELITSSTMAA